MIMDFRSHLAIVKSIFFHARDLAHLNVVVSFRIPWRSSVVYSIFSVVMVFENLLSGPLLSSKHKV